MRIPRRNLTAAFNAKMITADLQGDETIAI